MSKIKYKENGLLIKILNIKFFVLLSNLIFQGIPYMTLGEKIYKISISFLFALIVYIFLQNIFYSLILGHFLNYILNGQFFVVYRYVGEKDTMNKDKLNHFLDFIIRMTHFFKPIDILFTGSFSKGKMSKTSDLDIRIYHHSSFVASLKAYIMATILRFYGLMTRFPIDVYCFSDLSFLGPEKIDPSEIPVHIYGEKKFLINFPTSKKMDEHLKSLVIK